MPLRTSKTFRVIAGIFVCLAAVAQTSRIVYMVVAGHGADTYANVYGSSVAYWSELVVMALMVAIGLLAIGIKLAKKFEK